MTRTSNALSQPFSNNPAWTGEGYADFSVFDPGEFKRFNPSKYKNAFPDYSQSVFAPAGKADAQQPEQTSDTGSSPDTSSSAVPVDTLSQNLLDLQKAQKALLPGQLDYSRQLSQQQSDINFEQMMRSYPILSQAAYEATQRNLAASKNFLFAKEMTPTAQQARMQSASASEATRAQAIAAQQLAAKDFAGRFAGSTFQVG